MSRSSTPMLPRPTSTYRDFRIIAIRNPLTSTWVAVAQGMGSVCLSGPIAATSRAAISGVVRQLALAYRRDRGIFDGPVESARAGDIWFDGRAYHGPMDFMEAMGYDIIDGCLTEGCDPAETCRRVDDALGRMDAGLPRGRR